MLLYHRVNGEILHRFTLYKSRYTIFKLHVTTWEIYLICGFAIFQLWGYIWQITKGNAGTASALESMIVNQLSCCFCKDWSTLIQ